MVALREDDAGAPDPLELLRSDAVCVCAEYFRRAEARGDPLRCPGCAALENEERDLVADAIMRILSRELAATRARRRAKAAAQILIPLDVS
jgi:hypothetical protein